MKIPIIDSLIEYDSENIRRFHMPGHKGETKHLLNTIRDKLYSFDITEIDGLDDLHNPTGIIKESQEITAEILGAKESYYLVNGSTAGIYSMILSVVNKGDKIIVQRNSHKSVFMAAYLGELTLEYISPSILENFSIGAGLNIDEIERVIVANLDAKALVITSPNYYGICLDIEAISKITRKYNMLLLVDSAHGAHFPFNENLPKSAILSGADLEVLSVHKTLPSLTQTAILNVSKEGSDRVDLEKLKFMLRLYQTSSPSYIFLASIEASIAIMNDGKETLSSIINYIDEFKEEIRFSRLYKVLDSSYIGKSFIFQIDKTRLVISSKIGGRKLSDILRKDYGIQVEMADTRNIVLIGSIFDSHGSYKYLYDALIEIEKRYEKIKYDEIENFSSDFHDEKYLSIYEAYIREKEMVFIENVKNRICGDFITPYPPGVPLIVPGEIITEEKIEYIKTCLNLGIEINGLRNKCINVIK